MEYSLHGYFAGRSPGSFSFPGENLLRIYGPDWRTTYNRIVQKRLRSWGLNTIGNWSDEATRLMHLTPYVDSISSYGSEDDRKREAMATGANFRMYSILVLRNLCAAPWHRRQARARATHGASAISRTTSCLGAMKPRWRSARCNRRRNNRRKRNLSPISRQSTTTLSNSSYRMGHWTIPHVAALLSDEPR